MSQFLLLIPSQGKSEGDLSLGKRDKKCSEVTLEADVRDQSFVTKTHLGLQTGV